MRRTALFKRATSLAVGGSLTLYVWFNREKFQRRSHALLAAGNANGNVNHLTQDSGTTPGPGPSDKEQRELQLKNVQIFFRHGARTPLHHAPGIEEAVYDRNYLIRPLTHTEVPYVLQDLGTGKGRPHSNLEDKYKKTQFPGGCYAGMLTTIGKDQMFLLGRRIRKRYIRELALIADEFESKEVFVRSTNVQRCIHSLQCVLAGMYGQASFKDPVVIPVSAYKDEVLYPNLRHCDTLRQLELKVAHILPDLPEIKQVHDRIAKIIGYNEVKPMEMMCWRDNLVSRQTHGLPVPDWLLDMKDEVDVAALEALKHYMCGEPGDRQLVLMLAAGPVLHMVEQNIQQCINNAANAKKMHLYSVHDSSLVPLMMALDCFDERWPPYGADFRVELYSDQKNQHWVKMLYCDKELRVNGASQMLLPLSEFRELLARYQTSPPMYESRCHDIQLAREHAAAIESSQDTEEAELVPPFM